MCGDMDRTLGRPLSKHPSFWLVPECVAQIKPMTVPKLYQRCPKAAFARYVWVYVKDFLPSWLQLIRIVVSSG